MRVIIQVMDKRMGKKNGGMYGKDIRICTIECCDPWCHRTFDINDTGNY